MDRWTGRAHYPRMLEEDGIVCNFHVLLGCLLKVYHFFLGTVKIWYCNIWPLDFLNFFERVLLMHA